jgi:hypothetical protein
VWRQLIVEGASSGPLLGQGVFLVPFYLYLIIKKIRFLVRPFFIAPIFPSNLHILPPLSQGKTIRSVLCVVTIDARLSPGRIPSPQHELPCALP